MGYFSYQLSEDEDLIEVIRRHWITLAPAAAKVILSLVSARVVYQVVQDIPYGSEFILIWILASILYIVYEAGLWYMDCYIITNKRIIDVDQKGMFKRVVAEIDSDSVDEVIYEVDGPLEALFNYGTVDIKISASGGIIAMEHIPQPERVKKLLSKMKAKD